MAEDRNPTLKQTFEAIDLPQLKAIQNDPQKLASVREADDWARKAHKELAEQVKAHRAEWVAKESDAVWLEREKNTLEFNPPIEAGDIMEESRRRVTLRIQAASKQIDTIRKNRIAELTQTGPQHAQAKEGSAETQRREPAHPLKKDIHALADRKTSVRLKSEFHFRKHREAWIAAAQDRGVAHPVREIYARQDDRIRRIERAEHRMMDRLFEEHGYDKETPLVQASHAVLTKCNTERRNCERDFRAQRESLLKQAMESETPNPAGSVYRAQADKIKEIDQAKHKSLHKVFEAHGLARSRAQSRSQGEPSMAG